MLIAYIYYFQLLYYFFIELAILQSVLKIIVGILLIKPLNIPSIVKSSVDSIMKKEESIFTSDNSFGIKNVIPMQQKFLSSHILTLFKNGLKETFFLNFFSLFFSRFNWDFFLHHILQQLLSANDVVINLPSYFCIFKFLRFRIN